MEMISASKMKKMQDRLVKSRPFRDKISEILGKLVKTGVGRDNPLFKAADTNANSLIIVLTGNRGLCGGYNTNIIENSLTFRDKLKSENGKEAGFKIIGQKGINYFKSYNIPMTGFSANPDDKISLEYASVLAKEMISMFERNEAGEIYISYTKMISSASHKPAIHKLLPLSINDFLTGDTDADKENNSEDLQDKYAEYIIEPDPESLFKYLLPFYFNILIYSLFLESGYSEQNARRASMKNATDAANDMVKNLTIKYNRTRQSKITNEIAEIVGGASALE